MTQYCLRWHNLDDPSDAFDHRNCEFPFALPGTWGMERAEFLRNYFLFDGMFGSGKIDDNPRITQEFCIHIIHPVDWDYIGERGV